MCWNDNNYIEEALYLTFLKDIRVCSFWIIIIIHNFFLIVIKFEAQVWLNDLDKIKHQVSGWTGKRTQVLFFQEHDIFSPLFSPLPLSLAYLLHDSMLIKHSNNMNVSGIIIRSYCLSLRPAISPSVVVCVCVRV